MYSLKITHSVSVLYYRRRNTVCLLKEKSGHLGSNAFQLPHGCVTLGSVCGACPSLTCSLKVEMMMMMIYRDLLVVLWSSVPGCCVGLCRHFYTFMHIITVHNIFWHRWGIYIYIYGVYQQSCIITVHNNDTTEIFVSICDYSRIKVSEVGANSFS